MKSFLYIPAVLVCAATLHAQYSSANNSAGSRGEVFVTGFAALTSDSSGNSITQEATNSGGFAVGYRFHLNSTSSVEARYGFNRNSQKYDIGGTISSIPSYSTEVSGGYVFSLRRIYRLQPFLEGGGGIVHFSPGSYGAPPNPVTSGVGGASPASPYALAHPRTFAPGDVPVYTGSTPGIDSQTKPSFYVGGGFDVPLIQRFYFRVEYRAIGYATPDFGQSGLRTGGFSFLSEPSLGFTFRF